ncbi:hypothetical protein NPIL_12111 [Nephila pilipes]|uniref:Uncharacterized protein n=1 Tax=Nephila pilipes TaxID=299642 RepID=A0A8X6QY76_NEPPI|nr:hypothetical protein NPIL_12111 [Nephila pilipes]
MIQFLSCPTYSPGGRATDKCQNNHKRKGGQERRKKKDAGSSGVSGLQRQRLKSSFYRMLPVSLRVEGEEKNERIGSERRG